MECRLAGDAGDLWCFGHFLRHQLCSHLLDSPDNSAHIVSIDDTTVNNRTAEEQIRARLRELTDELRDMRRKINDRPERSTSNDRPGRRMPKPPRTPAPPKR
jgi:hypothetical protein